MLQIREFPQSAPVPSQVARAKGAMSELTSSMAVSPLLDAVPCRSRRSILAVGGLPASTTFGSPSRSGRHGEVSMFLAQELVTTGWDRLLKYGLPGAFVIMIGLIGLMVRRDTVTATSLVAIIIGAMTSLGAWAILVFGGREPEGTLTNEYRSALVALCDLDTAKLATLQDPNAQAIAEQMRAVIDRQPDIDCVATPAPQRATTSTIRR